MTKFRLPLWSFIWIIIFIAMGHAAALEELITERETLDKELGKISDEISKDKISTERGLDEKCLQENFDVNGREEDLSKECRDQKKEGLLKVLHHMLNHKTIFCQEAGAKLKFNELNLKIINNLKLKHKKSNNYADFLDLKNL